jgi:hypothetical protein
MRPTQDWRRLGELIVDRGLVDDEQLEDALLEQRVSRKRLGAILVAQGAISPPDLTAALMSQLGDRPAPEPARAVAPEPVPVDHEPEETHRKGLFRRRRPVEDAPAQNGASPAPAIAEPERRPMLDAETLDLLQDIRGITQAHLDALRHEFEEAGRELEAARIEIQARDRRIAELEALLQASDAERYKLSDALRAEMARTEARLREYRPPEPAAVTAHELEPAISRTVVEPDRSVGPPRPESFLLLVPDAVGGHALRESAGEPPPVSSRIAVGGQRFVVVSHRRSPIGTDERLCVQLAID